MQKSDDLRTTGLKSSLAAVISGTVSKVMHPLELKIQNKLLGHDGFTRKNLVPKYKGVINGIKQIFQTEGIKGMYRGLILSTLFKNANKIVLFGTFGMQKRRYQIEFGSHSEKAILFSTFQASLLTSILKNPITTIKTRMLLNTNPKITGLKNFLHETKLIYNQYGVRGFFRGYQINLLLSSHSFLKLFLYENFKLLYEYTQENSFLLPALFGASSKLIASSIFYPLEVVRTRVQQNQFIGIARQKYRGISDIIYKIWEYEGMRGFYKGYMVELTKSLPSNGLFFLLFELFMQNMST